MQIKTIMRLIGVLLMIFSLSMLTPLLINFIFKENFWLPFVLAFLFTGGFGLILWLIFRNHQKELKIRDGFLIVVLFWFVLSFFASLPFIFAIKQTDQSMTDALFESVSGFTTTGASIITNLNALPHSVLYYRQQLQFLGGMGIIVLAVAILPMLGVGGMQLIRAETPGPMKDTKLTPRVAQTAKALWFIYFFLTLTCMLSYWAAGMNWFDAIGESFATVSTGGFSMHNSGFSFYQSDHLEFIASIFMLLGGTNFALHFIALEKKKLKHYWEDEEFRYYLSFLLLITVIVAISLVSQQFYDFSGHVLIKSLFNVISFATTTGFASDSFNFWPSFIPFLLLLLGIIGGCAASTSGGIKFLRALTLYKQSRREMFRLIHPQAVQPIKLGNQTLSESILQSMWGFLAAFIALFLILMIIFISLGNDFVTSFSAISATLANTGVGLGKITENFSVLNLPSKWLLMVAMIAGRLEIFSLLILFTRPFWTK